MNDKIIPFYRPEEVYSVTINPQEQYVNSIDRLSKFHNMMYGEMIGLIDNGIHYSFYTEISEPRGNTKYHQECARLHLHGIIYFEDYKAVRHFLLHTVTRWCKISKWEVDTIDSLEKWKKYCKKQQFIMRQKKITSCDTLWDKMEEERPPKQNEELESHQT